MAQWEEYHTGTLPTAYGAVFRMAPGVVRQGDHRMITLMKWGTYLEDHPNKSVILVITHLKQWGHAIKWRLSNGYQPATGMILQVAR